MIVLSDAQVAFLDPIENEAEREEGERLLTDASICPVHGFVLLDCPLCAIAISEIASSLPETP